MTSSRARSNGITLSMNCYGIGNGNSDAMQRSISSDGRFATSVAGSSSSSFCSTPTAFSLASPGFFTRSALPMRVNVYGSASAAPSVRFSLDRSKSPSRSLTGLPVSSCQDMIVKKRKPMTSMTLRRMCMCSPQTHPGSFRCSLHKSTGFLHNQLDARRSSITNSLFGIPATDSPDMQRMSYWIQVVK